MFGCNCMAEATVDLERLLSRCDALLLNKTDTQAGRLRLSAALTRMDQLLSSVADPTFFPAALLRAVERYRALGDQTAGPLLGVPSAVRLAVAAPGLGPAERAAHVGAGARAAAAQRKAAKNALLGTEEGEEESEDGRVAWEGFRSAAEAGGGAGDAQRLVAYHLEEHERIAEEMVAGSASMRAAAAAIEATLRADTGRLQELNQLSATNAGNLVRERNRIQRQVGRSCSFTLVVMAVCAVVLIVFFWMVLVIRLGRKSVS